MYIEYIKRSNNNHWETKCRRSQTGIDSCKWATCGDMSRDYRVQLTTAVSRTGPKKREGTRMVGGFRELSPWRILDGEDPALALRV